MCNSESPIEHAYSWLVITVYPEQNCKCDVGHSGESLHSTVTIIMQLQFSIKFYLMSAMFTMYYLSKICVLLAIEAHYTQHSACFPSQCCLPYSCILSVCNNTKLYTIQNPVSAVFNLLTM